MAAGALCFDEAGRVLLVKPTYRDRWGIPGGNVEHDESPRAGCQRELREELGREIEVGQLLCVEHCPADDVCTESLQFVFDGGTVEGTIRLPAGELGAFRFAALDELPALLSDRLLRRVRAALDGPTYLD